MSGDPFAWLARAAQSAEPVAPVAAKRRRVEDTDEAHPMAWTNGAACAPADPETFYPVDWTSPDVAEPARAICTGCPVFTDCHDWALHHETDGIWAGTTPKQRRALRRSLRIADPAELGRDAVHDEVVGITPPLWELDVNRSAREVAQAAGVSTRTVIRHRTARRNTA